MDAETAALFQGAAVAGGTPSPAGGDLDINDIIDSPPDIIGGLDLEALGVTVKAEAAARPQQGAARRRRRRWGPGKLFGAGGGTGGGTGGAATAEAEAAALPQEGTAMTGDKPPSPAGGGPPSRRRPSCSPARAAVAEASEAPASEAPAGSHGESGGEVSAKGASRRVRGKKRGLDGGAVADGGADNLLHFPAENIGPVGLGLRGRKAGASAKGKAGSAAKAPRASAASSPVSGEAAAPPPSPAGEAGPHPPVPGVRGGCAARSGGPPPARRPRVNAGGPGKSLYDSAYCKAYGKTMRALKDTDMEDEDRRELARIAGKEAAKEAKSQRPGVAQPGDAAA